MSMTWLLPKKHPIIVLAIDSNLGVNKSAVVLFSAGEPSGDQHAANLFSELKKRRPDIQGIGMGGAQMAAVGIDIRYDSSQIAVIGVIEVIRHYPKIRQALAQMQRLLRDERPSLLVCVDYKEFNFKLATYAKRLGIKVLFYVSPQVWAWRPGRVKQYGRVIDMMAVIFPFETAYYEAENVPVRYVGHPSVDKVKPLHGKSEALREFGLSANKKTVGLLPGSRVNEIKRLLPVMLAAAQTLQTQFPGLQFILPQAPSIADALLAECLRQSTVNVVVIKNQPYDAMHCCDAIMVGSGTASLEIALLGIPMLICYKLSPITYWLGRLLVKTPFIGLPNIMAGKLIVREFIQHAANPENLAAEIRHLLTDSRSVNQMRADLAEVKRRLGPGGASKALAELVLQLLD